MNKALYFVSFLCGGIVGVLGTWKYFEKKYEKISNEEIESVKEVFCNLKTSEKCENTYYDDNVDADVDKKDCKSTEEDSSYTYMTRLYEDKPREDPYIITPDEFREDNDYDKITLTYYSDNVLTDDNDNIIYDIDDVVGENSLKSFGRYEEDVAYVRNERYRSDYEIIREDKSYDEVCGR